MYSEGADVVESGERALRADARANEDRIIAAAARAFTRDSAAASLKAIAQDAGVGIGTLYRRFPTRQDLVWAVYRSEVERVCALVPRLLKRAAPPVALRRWATAFLDLLASRAGMADALKAALGSDERQRLATRALIVDALGTLLAAGAEDGSLRADVDPLDVMMALGGAALITSGPDQHGRASRLVDLLLAGIVAER